MADTIHINVSGNVPQGNSCILEFPLTDYDETTPVSVDNISTATLTLKNHDTNNVINSKEDGDVKSSFNQQGIFSHYLDGDDNEIVEQTGSEIIQKQVHVAIITITATGATQPIVFKREFWITIINQEHITNP